MTRPSREAATAAVREIEVASADELLRLLDRDHPTWRGAPNNWVFRGQADARWPLLPEALR